MAKAKPKSKGGRPPISFDLDEVEKLGALHASPQEVASWFNVNHETITDHLAKDPEFSAAFKKGQGKGKLKLRRAQQQAADSGNITMLIWLGKQLLDQQDFPAVNLSISNEINSAPASFVLNDQTRDAIVRMTNTIRKEAEAQRSAQAAPVSVQPTHNGELHATKEPNPDP